MTAPKPSIFSSWSDHCWRVMCCSVMRVVLWHKVQAAFTLACMGPGGSGLPGVLGACALARMMDANTKIAGQTRWNKQESPDSVLSSQFSVLSSQFSVLSSQKFDNFVPQDDAISLLLFSIVVRLGFLERRRPVGG